MRRLADVALIRAFMRALGGEAGVETRVYFTGGATAVLYGWRAATIDIDVKFVPEDDRLFRALPGIKERLQANIELASPADFIPVRDDWEDRSPFIDREGRVFFHHFDLYAQALAKIERGHERDVADVAEMIRRKLVEPAAGLSYFRAIEPQLYRYPALDPGTFRRAVEEVFGRTG